MKDDGNNGKNAKNGKHDSHSSHPSHEGESSHPIIPPRGDYQTLHSFHKAEVIYHLTFRFAHNYLSRGDRTIDQMIQSARSGKKNILEAAEALATETRRLETLYTQKLAALAALKKSLLHQAFSGAL